MIENFTKIEMLISFFTLTTLEIVLGIDNIIFISIVTSVLPINKQQKARLFGIILAMITRIILLLLITWVMSFTTKIVNIFSYGFSGRDIILFVGGLFLVCKSVLEIYKSIDPPAVKSKNVKTYNIVAVILQIAIIDIVLSLDSVITAVGLVNNVNIIIIAIIISVAIMLFVAESISNFIKNYPSLKILALSFLMILGVILIAESLAIYIAKSNIYFAIAFSLIVEILNIRLVKSGKKINNEH